MNLQQLKKRTQLGNSGFSLVELIIVIAIMAILIAVLAPMFIRYVERSRISRDVNAAGEMVQTLKTIISDPQLSSELTGSYVTANWVGGGTITVVPGGQVEQAFISTVGSTTVAASSNTFVSGASIHMSVGIGDGRVSVIATGLGGTDANRSYMISLLSGIN